jgi:hypothetical protein
VLAVGKYVFIETELPGLISFVQANYLAPATQQQYKSLWNNQWLVFLEKKGLDKDVYLTDYTEADMKVTVIGLFMQWICIHQGHPYKRMTDACSALRYYFTSNKHDVSFLNHPFLVMTRMALNRTAPSAIHRTRLPTTYDMVERIRDVCWTGSDRSGITDPSKEKMAYLGCALAFNFMLRVSEYTFGDSGAHTLMCGDVCFVGEVPESLRWSPDMVRDLAVPSSRIRMVQLDIRTSKTDQGGASQRGRKLSLIRGTHLESQLVDDLVRWCKVSFIVPGDPFLSRRFQGKSLKLRAKDINRVLKDAADHFHLDKEQFKSHSLRIGGITAKSRAGCDPAETRKVAGFKHNSHVMELYDQLTTQDRGALSSVDPSVLHHRVSARDVADMQRSTTGSSTNSSRKRSKRGTYN